LDLRIIFEPFDNFEIDALALIGFEQTAQAHPWIAELTQSGEFSGKLHDLVILHHPTELKAKRLVAVGGGKADKFTPGDLRKLAGGLVRQLKAKSIKRLGLVLSEAFQYPDFVAAAAEGAIVGDWEPGALKAKRDDIKMADEFILICPGGPEELSTAFRKGRTIGESQNLARDLANEPPNVLTPRALAVQSKALADECGLACDVLDADRMRQLGMGALLGVAQGSAEPPQLIVLSYTPVQAPRVNHHLGLIGKAVTFDTGGISLKPADNMDRMKFDMAGGAAMLGAMLAIAHLKPHIPVTAFIPAVENMPGGKAQRPGDIVKTMSGLTVDVLNTDAEGRLIMADAITYAKRQGVTHLVDAATLTGAVVMALGAINSGVFSNSDEFQRRVIDVARGQGEKVWPMPMDDEYREMLKSHYADLPNIGSKGAGSVTAAKFLQEFVGDTPWVHFDIAGTAWIDEAKPHMAAGPTGVCVRTFTQLALEWDNL
jgi:leucyl aminopeptidase